MTLAGLAQNRATLMDGQRSAFLVSSRYIIGQRGQRLCGRCWQLLDPENYANRVVTTLAGLAGMGSADGTNSTAQFNWPECSDGRCGQHLCGRYQQLRDPEDHPCRAVMTLADWRKVRAALMGWAMRRGLIGPTAWQWTMRAISTPPTPSIAQSERLRRGSGDDAGGSAAPFSVAWRRWKPIGVQLSFWRRDGRRGQHVCGRH